MAAQDFAQNKARLSDWIPLDMKGKPMYVVESALKSETFSRDLRSMLHTVLDENRYWADQQRSLALPQDLSSRKDENYGALEAYTTNEGYKNIFGHINQIFRKHHIDENEIAGAVALVELLTINLYNLRLANIGCFKYYNFQGIVHRGLSVDQGVLDTFRGLMKEEIPTEPKF